MFLLPHEAGEEKEKRKRPEVSPRPLRLRISRGSAARRQVHCGILAAAVHLELELEPVAFVERRHAGALDGADMDERIGLPVVALDKAEALHRVEELDRAGRLLAGQLALRAAGAA